MGKCTISMAMFNCYVSSPEGTNCQWYSYWSHTNISSTPLAGREHVQHLVHGRIVQLELENSHVLQVALGVDAKGDHVTSRSWGITRYHPANSRDLRWFTRPWIKPTLAVGPAKTHRDKVILLEPVKILCKKRQSQNDQNRNRRI